LPLLFASIIALGAGKFGNMLADASAFALFMLGAVLTRRGMQEAAGSAERRYGKRPWITLKNLGAACVTAATATAAFFGVGHGLANSLAFGGVSLLAFHLVYGLDPIRRAELRIPGISQKDQVTETLAEAEERLLSIETSARRLRNPELRGRLGRIAGQGREILALIERRPRDLRRARKFLTVYLEGAESVSQGYAAAHQVVDTGDLEQNFRNVLVTIEDVFAEQQKRLLETDLMDLDVQIEVLNKQLKREGIR
jgi:hypothetical protein